VEKIALRPEEALILDTLRLIEPRIEAFRTRGGVLAEAVPSTSPLLGREGIIVKIRDLSRLEASARESIASSRSRSHS